MSGGAGGLAAAVQSRAGGWDAEVHERTPPRPVPGRRPRRGPGPCGHSADRGPAVPRGGSPGPRRNGGFQRAGGGLIGNLGMAALRRRTGDPVRATARITLLETLADALAEG